MPGVNQHDDLCAKHTVLIPQCCQSGFRVSDLALHLLAFRLKICQFLSEPLNLALRSHFLCLQFGYRPPEVGKLRSCFGALVEGDSQLLFRVGKLIAAGQQSLRNGLLTGTKFFHFSLTFSPLLTKYGQCMFLLNCFGLKFTKRRCCSHALAGKISDGVFQIGMKPTGMLNDLPSFLQSCSFIGDGTPGKVEGGLAFPALCGKLRVLLF